MSDLINKIDTDRLPKHVAIIMDGNGRWAKAHGKPRIFGHQNGVKAVREVTEAAAELGVQYLTLYAFSKENWDRPKLEVNALMHLLIDTVRKELSTLNDNDVSLEAIGDISKLPSKTAQALKEGIEQTRNNKRMKLILALNYSARWEITEMARSIARNVESGELHADDITETLVSQNMTTRGFPNPELMIRTSGERRISNFLLWQLAYAEFYFTEVFWPDFRKNDFYEALIDYQSRERRFGKISEQLTGS